MILKRKFGIRWVANKISFRSLDFSRGQFFSSQTKIPRKIRKKSLDSAYSVSVVAEIPS